MELSDLLNFYERLDSEFHVIHNDLVGATYTNVESNFVFSSKYARHRWFNYKEGFSPILVEKIFHEYVLTKDSIVCDPFCGAGTTLAVAKANGMRSVGFEVNPFAAYITKVKTNDYSEEDTVQLGAVLKALENIEINTEISLPDNEYLCRIFSADMLLVQLNIRDYLTDLAEGKAKELLYFAWLCTLESCSLFRKAGNGLKVKKNPPRYENAFAFAFRLISDKVNAIIEDFNTDSNGPIPTVYTDSVTTLKERIPNQTLDMVLFSPPYANCFDYTKIYYLELWFGGFINSAQEQKDIRMKSLRSHCHATWPERYSSFRLSELNDELLPLLSKQKLWTKRIPDMLNGYFADMEEALKQIYNSLKVGGHCAIVVSNSAYAGIIIPTDLLLAKIALRLGFKVREIETERLIITSSQQYKKTEAMRKYLRESIIKLER